VKRCHKAQHEIEKNFSDLVYPEFFIYSFVATLIICTVHKNVDKALNWCDELLNRSPLPKTMYIEKIDFQDIFIAVVNWPISELYGAFVCTMHYLDQSATS